MQFISVTVSQSDNNWLGYITGSRILILRVVMFLVCLIYKDMPSCYKVWVLFPFLGSIPENMGRQCYPLITLTLFPSQTPHSFLLLKCNIWLSLFNVWTVQCSQCFKQFNAVNVLNSSMQSMFWTVQCSQCFEQFNAANALNNSMQSVFWTIQCSQCFEQFNAVSVLNSSIQSVFWTVQSS